MPADTKRRVVETVVSVRVSVVFVVVTKRRAVAS